VATRSGRSGDTVGSASQDSLGFNLGKTPWLSRRAEGKVVNLGVGPRVISDRRTSWVFNRLDDQELAVLRLPLAPRARLHRTQFLQCRGFGPRPVAPIARTLRLVARKFSAWAANFPIPDRGSGNRVDPVITVSSGSQALTPFRESPPSHHSAARIESQSALFLLRAVAAGSVDQSASVRHCFSNNSSEAFFVIFSPSLDQR